MSNNLKLPSIIIFVIVLLFFTFYFNAQEVLSDISDGNKNEGSQLITENKNDGLLASEEIDKERIEEVVQKPTHEDKVIIDSKGKILVSNLTDILVLVNKVRSLPSNYVPNDLVIPNITFSIKGDSPKKLMREEAARAIEKLFTKAKEDNIAIAGVSGYRSYETQAAIFASNVKKKGEEAANKFSARPGESEHQTGLAMDVSSPSVGYRLLEILGEKPEGIWLKDNAPNYGFIIRYPKEKTAITGYIYEPWHLRYVGVQAAKEISEKNITLEEYLEK